MNVGRRRDGLGSSIGSRVGEVARTRRGRRGRAAWPGWTTQRQAGGATQVTRKFCSLRLPALRLTRRASRTHCTLALRRDAHNRMCSASSCSSSSQAEEVVFTTSPSERTDRGHGDSSSQLAWHERLACSVVRTGPIPSHVAFIMDGNRRFARDRGWEIEAGHRLGYDKLEEVRALTPHWPTTSISILLPSLPPSRRRCAGASSSACTA